MKNIYSRKILIKTTAYDVEININSILEIKKGWDVTFSMEGKQKFEEAKELPTKIFSVIGIRIGESLMSFSKISGKNLPRGYNVTTKEISISFPDYGDIAVLDSAGLESPLLESDSEQYRLKSKDEKNSTFYEELEELRKEIKEKKESKCSLKELKIMENKFLQKKTNFINQFLINMSK